MLANGYRELIILFFFVLLHILEIFRLKISLIEKYLMNKLSIYQTLVEEIRFKRIINLGSAPDEFTGRWKRRAC